MGFQSFIADAAGKLHDVSKSAFDTFGMKHQGKFRPGFGNLMEGSFLDGAKKILSKAGVSGEDLESWGGTGVAEAMKQAGGVIGGEVAAAGAGAAVGGPLGAALGIAVESGQMLYKLFKKKHPTVFYQEGQWVAIDNGQTVATLGMQNALDNSAGACWTRGAPKACMSASRCRSALFWDPGPIPTRSRCSTV